MLREITFQTKVLIFQDPDFGDKNSGFDKAFIGQVSEVQEGLLLGASTPMCTLYSDVVGDTCASELSCCLCLLVFEEEG